MALQQLPCLTVPAWPANLPPMSFLLPQDRMATVARMQPVDIHGDRYFDLSLVYEGDEATGARMARVGRSECPQGLAAGERVSVRIVMGVVTRVARAD